MREERGCVARLGDFRDELLSQGSDLEYTWVNDRLFLADSVSVLLTTSKSL